MKGSYIQVFALPGLTEVFHGNRFFVKQNGNEVRANIEQHLRSEELIPQHLLQIFPKSPHFPL